MLVGEVIKDRDGVGFLVAESNLVDDEILV